jgi:hypothetical protein
LPLSKDGPRRLCFGAKSKDLDPVAFTYAVAAVASSPKKPKSVRHACVRSGASGRGFRKKQHRFVFIQVEHHFFFPPKRKKKSSHQISETDATILHLHV